MGARVGVPSAQRIFLGEKLSVEMNIGTGPRFRYWGVYRSGDGLVAQVTASKDGSFAAKVSQKFLAVRAAGHFDITGIAFSPFSLAVALASQWSDFPLAPVDLASDTILKEAAAGGWLEGGCSGEEEEDVDVADEQSGFSMGVLPRNCVHLYSIPHRGIGVLVRRKPVVIAKPGDNENAAEEQDARGSIFVHQRAAEKRIFSSLLDMFVGEPAEVTVLRELKEELNIDAQHSSGSDSSSSSSSCHRLDFLFDCTVSTELNRCRVSVFDLPDCSPAAAASIRFQASEAQGGAWEARTVVDLAAEASWRAHVLSPQKLPLPSPPHYNGPMHLSSPSAPASREPPLEFVPDGLAVWNAYLGWELKQASS